MRLFVAIDLDEEARHAIGKEQQRIEAHLGQAARRARFVSPAHLHLTLVFVGHVEQTLAAKLVAVLGADLPIPRFDITFGELGAYPVHGAPRVLWLGLLTGAPETIALQALVQARLESVGIQGEGREYHPHLTIARWRQSRPSDRRQALAASRGAVARVRVAEVSLYESQLSPSGPTYTRLSSGRLT